MKKVKDHFFHKAKREHFHARSVYKLKEINEKYRIIKRGIHVLDLGSAPGSWLQYASQIVGKDGLVVGIDTQKLAKDMQKNIHFMQGDIFEMDVKLIQSISDSFHLILSDMAPKTTGIKTVDHLRSYELCMKALEIADVLLKDDGTFVCKIFTGEELTRFREEVKKRFKSAKIFKPKSSRSESKEVFVIGMGYSSSVEIVRRNKETGMI